jgi:hypothetical protein
VSLAQRSPPAQHALAQTTPESQTASAASDAGSASIPLPASPGVTQRRSMQLCPLAQSPRVVHPAGVPAQSQPAMASVASEAKTDQSSAVSRASMRRG